ncbi:MAG: hypothetical protein JWN72_430 [Thermoleophilia bacterium]|nr:hypothetical protein [Thermoleophilia bacterium]
MLVPSLLAHVRRTCLLALAVVGLTLVGATTAGAAADHTWDLTISASGATQNVTTPSSFFPYIVPTGPGAVISESDLSGYLTQWPITLDTTYDVGSGMGDGAILVSGAVTLTGDQGITFNAPEITIPSVALTGGSATLSTGWDDNPDITASGESTAITAAGSIAALNPAFAGPVVLAGDLTIVVPDQYAINFNRRGITGAHALTVVGEAAVNFPGQIGTAGAPLTSITVPGMLRSTADVYANTIDLGSVYGDDDTAYALHANGDVEVDNLRSGFTPNGDVTISAGSGDVSLGFVFTKDLTVNSTGTLSFQVNKTQFVTGALTTDAGGTTDMSDGGPSPSTGASIGDRIVAGTNSVNFSTSGAISVHEIETTGSVGLSSPVSVALRGALGTAIDPVGSVTISDGLLTGTVSVGTGTAIHAINSVTVGRPMTLGANLVVTSGLDADGEEILPVGYTRVTLKEIDGAYGLDVRTTSYVDFNGDVGATTALTTIDVPQGYPLVHASLKTTSNQTFARNISVDQTSSVVFDVGTAGKLTAPKGISAFDGSGNPIAIGFVGAAELGLDDYAQASISSYQNAPVNLIKSGTGTLTTGVITSAGSLTVAGGTAHLLGDFTAGAVALTGGTLALSNSLTSVGSITATSGSIAPSSVGVPTVGHALYASSFTGGTGVTFAPRLGFSNGSYDRIISSAAPTLTGTTLDLSAPSTVPAVGDALTIVDNYSADPIVGTFDGLAQGATITVGGFAYRVSYTDGSGSNDVTLTRLAQIPVVTPVAAPLTPSTYPTSPTFTVTVSATQPDGAVSGAVTLLEGGVDVGSGTVTNGVATIDTTLGAGSHTLSVSFVSNVAAYLDAASSPFTYVVLPTTTAVALTPAATTSVLGSATTFSAVVTGLDASQANVVTLSEGATVLGTSTIPSGTTSGTVSLAPSLGVGVHTITASVAASANATGSSSVVTHTVLKRPTTTLLIASSPGQVLGSTVAFTATALATNAIPGGTITFRDGATVLATIPVGVQGGATLFTATLTVGAHTVIATYDSDAANAGSVSTAVRYDVSAPPVVAPPVVPVIKLVSVVSAVPKSTTIASVLKSGLATTVQLNQAGTITTTLTIPASVAKRLGLLPKGSKRTTPVVIGSSVVKRTAAGPVVTTTKLTLAAKKALAKAKTVKVAQTIKITTAGGSKTITRAVVVTKKK